MSKKQELEWTHIIQSGFKLLAETLLYRQINIVNKLNILEYKISTAALSKILSNNGASKATLHKVAEGIQKIIEAELGYNYDREQQKFIISTAKTEHWQPLILTKQPEIEPSDPAKVKFHADGRLPIHKKIEFMQRAQREIIEVGVRLHTFVGYFNTRSKSEFAIHIEALLERGVHIKLYLLDPESNESLLYFKDRGKAQEEELNAIADTRAVIKRLQIIKAAFEKKNYRGQLEVFSYKHIPYNYFLVTDVDTALGHIMISHYIYGLERADCPVFEIAKAINESLYLRYLESLQAFIKDAKKLA